MSRESGITTPVLGWPARVVIFASLVVLLMIPSRPAKALIWACHGVITITGPDGKESKTPSCGWEGGGAPAGSTGGSGGPGNGHAGGGGGTVAPNPGDIAQQTDEKLKKDPCANETAGNPVVLSTGNKIEIEADFSTTEEMGLYLQRTYNSFWSVRGLFGNYWLSNLDFSLTKSSDQSIIWLQRPDGRRIKFLRVGTTDNYNEDRAAAVASVHRNTDGSFTALTEDRGEETYDSEGYVTKVKNELGVSWTFVYSLKRLQSVTHSSGKAMQFTWTGNQVSTVTDPAGNVYTFAYTPMVFGTGGRLASVSYPGSPSSTTTYHYEDARYPGGLTGKSLNGVRYSTFAYDAQGRAISTEHAGGVEHYAFAYSVTSTQAVTIPPAPPPPGGFADVAERGWCRYGTGSVRVCSNADSTGALRTAQSSANTTAATEDIPATLVVSETNPLGKVTQRTFVGGKLTAVNGLASAQCIASAAARTFDANGFLDNVQDFAGFTTDYDYDTAGRIQQTVEAKNTPRQRTTQYVWNAGGRIAQSTVLGQLKVAYAYLPDGRLSTVTETNLSSVGVPLEAHVRSFSYQKYPNGMIQTIAEDGPLSADTITSQYGQDGNLISVTNSLSQATTYSLYNGLGQPGRVVGPNGDAVTYQYDARGRVVSQGQEIAGISQATVYTYNPAGDISLVHTADGVETSYEYDAARRMVRSYTRASNGVYEITRFTRNNLSLVTGIVTEHANAISAPLAAPALSVPGTVGFGSFIVSWNGVANSSNYRLQELIGGSWSTIIDSGAVSYAVTNAAAGAHTYRVTACNDAGCSASSAAATVNVVYPPSAAPPISVPATSSTGSYTVSLQAVAAADTYMIEELASGGGWTVVQNGASTTLAIAGKPNGVYSYRARACNFAGCGAVSGAVSITVALPPAVPTGVHLYYQTLSPTSTNYRASWGVVPTATSYQLSGIISYTGPRGFYSLTINQRVNLAAKVKVRACNDVGCSAYSAEVTAEPL